MHRFAPAAFAVALFSFPSVLAGSEVALSAEALRDSCRRPSEAWVSFCNGYAQAIVDYADLTASACIPSATTRTEIVTMIDSMMFSNIESSETLKDAPAFAVALSVLEQVYPCEAGNRGQK